jgi:hypothetical protein
MHKEVLVSHKQNQSILKEILEQNKSESDNAMTALEMI